MQTEVRIPWLKRFALRLLGIPIMGGTWCARYDNRGEIYMLLRDK